MTQQTMKRLIALKFEGIKVNDLSVWGATAGTLSFTCSATQRLFLVEDAKTISEITPSQTKHYKDA